MLPLAVGLLALAVLAAFLAMCALLYARVFVPRKPAELDDFMFTPWEFQADYEEIDLVTADGVSFGAWYFRQPGSPQTVIVSGGHKGQRQNALHIAGALWREGVNVI